MKKICKIISALTVMLCIAAGCLGAVPVYAEDPVWPAGPEISAPNAIVMEASTGAVLYEKNADEKHYPASITKIMTTLLALEKCPLDETVTFSADAVYKNEGNTSHIARDLYEEMTMEQCLYGVMLESANECAYAVAEHIGGGSCQAFVDMMNERAQEIGCTNTHFNNPNGLPDETHVTTCRDMALISREAIKNDTFRTIISTVRYTIPPTNKHDTETPLNNHHRMISRYKGSQYLYDYAIGGKTGYTEAAGHTLVTYAEKDGMLLICVIMNSANTQYEDTRTLFDYCFENFQVRNVSQNETRFDAAQQESRTSLFGDIEPFAKLDEEALVVLPAAADFQDTQTSVSYDTSSDDVVGSIVYTYAGRQVGTADVITTGADGSVYEFGEKKTPEGLSEEESGTQSDGDSEQEETEPEEPRKGIGERIADRMPEEMSSVFAQFRELTFREKLIAMAILLAIIIVIILIIIMIINNIRREMRRRRRRRNARYKVIHSSQSKNRRRRRR